MSKFTPGPWEVDTVITSCGICHKIGPFPSGGHLEKNACIYVDNSDWSNSEELLANALLIAAAPEMYEALNVCLDEMVRYDFATLSIVPRIRAIIKKIEGAHNEDRTD